MPDYDAIVIGAGHNGLAAATILAKNGLKVLDVEKNDAVGGLAGTLEIIKGYRHNVGAWAMMFCPQRIQDELELSKYGLKTYTPETFLCSYGNRDEKPFIMYNDNEKLMAHLLNDHGQEALDGLMGLFSFFAAFAAGMENALFNPAISVGQIMDSMPSVQGREAMRKCFYGSMQDLLDEYFPRGKFNHLKNVLAGYSTDGCWAGPQSPGSAYSAAFHLTQQGIGHWASMPYGGMGSYSEAIRRHFIDRKGELKLKSPVKRVLVEKGKAAGIELENGEKITSKVVASNCDAYATMIKLVGEENLPEDFAKMVKTIHYRNPFLQVFVALKELPQFSGDLAFLNKEKTLWCCNRGKSSEGMERAWDACKHGRIPDTDDLTVGFYIPSMYDDSYAPKGSYSCTVYGMYFPITAPKEEHKRLKEKMADQVIEVITSYAPNFKSAIIDRKVLCPSDYEKIFGNTGGDFTHGTFEIGQMLDFRPVTGWSNYRMPVKGLYLCGSATHPGWGVTGIPGTLSAQAILKDWGK